MSADFSSVNEKVKGVVRSGISNEEAHEVYKQWAETYDKDMETLSRDGPVLAVNILEGLMQDKDARILDVAAGTGVIGQMLQDRGFSNMDALDGCREMLAKAKTKNIYRNFIETFLGPQETDMKKDTYDAVICVGSFYPGHLCETCFGELIRIVKPGGHIVITVSAGYQGKSRIPLEAEMQRFHDEKKWVWHKDHMVNNNTINDNSAKISHSVYRFTIL